MISQKSLRHMSEGFALRILDQGKDFIKYLV